MKFLTRRCPIRDLNLPNPVVTLLKGVE